MQAIHLSDDLSYDGSQLRPRFIYECTGLAGNALLSFTGPCRVDAAHMVDLEDVRKAAWIKSERMLHVVIELFDISLMASVGIQRLFMDLMRETLISFGVTGITRRGDDLYDGLYKLTVSIAAPAKTSCVIHSGINIVSRNTPVPTRGLDDYEISAQLFIERLVPAFLTEFRSMQLACYKVREI